MSQQPENRSVRQIEDTIEANRDQLAKTIDQLVHRTKPATIANRQKQQSLVKLQDFAYAPDGQLRVQRVAAVAAVVVGVIALAIYRRR